MHRLDCLDGIGDEVGRLDRESLWGIMPYMDDRDGSGLVAPNWLPDESSSLLVGRPYEVDCGLELEDLGNALAEGLCWRRSWPERYDSAVSADGGMPRAAFKLFWAVFSSAAADSNVCVVDRGRASCPLERSAGVEGMRDVSALI